MHQNNKLQAKDFVANNPVWLAPMAGINDSVFRGICRKMGAGLTFSEMVSAKGLHFNPKHRRSLELISLHPDEIPAVIQIFGSDPEIMAEQAARIAHDKGDELAFIDINMGCPVPKVAEKGDGSALMRNTQLAQEVVSSVAKALQPYGKQVSVKFRRGWSNKEDNVVEFALAMQEAGAAVLGVHGRYRDQYYAGKSDLEAIKSVTQAVEVPVVASGDIFSVEKIHRVLDEGIADAVFVARTAIGNPWIFREFHGGEAPSVDEKLNVLIEHAKGLTESLGEHSLVRIRRHASAYSAGLPGATLFRKKLQDSSNLKEFLNLVEEYRCYLNGSGFASA